jgi:hypothetical protein
MRVSVTQHVIIFILVVEQGLNICDSGILIQLDFLDIIHRPIFYLKQRCRDWILSSAAGKAYSVGPNRKS